MTLNIGSSLTGGLGRVATRNGALLVAAYAVVGLVWQVALYSLLATQLPRDAATGAAALPSVDAPLSVLALVTVLAFVALQYLTIVAVRVFVAGEARSIPGEYYRRNALGAFVNAVVGGLVYGVIVAIGTVLLVVPGIIAYVAFCFTIFHVIVDDENFVAALRDSWRLTRGNWLRLFVVLFILFVVVGVVGGVVSVVASVVIGAVAGPSAATVASGVFALPFSLLTLGVLAEAFVQLREGDAAV
ncbi:hypothetical protein J2752_001766 [Halarchaeum rubridurum]|uniref:DUF7847 domain-containing protein n=1 Tax=Halarchaeum rubridurum TaxID=489911 RepID=A0A830FKS7_9EURY|nr:hypothetical protein [Halarchaeum rubridurum]MBP1954854.1 hypothetical protein [Halarchaeum rubridurum]GGM60283.1 hypothetical protein GCM10009017_08040 [Halarchaeum rubridurum]